MPSFLVKPSYMEGDIYCCCICHRDFVDVDEVHTKTCLDCIKKYCPNKGGEKGACHCCENRMACSQKASEIKKT